MSEFPYMQFYPADWKTDPDLRKCSLASRGFWIEMLGSMHLDNRSGEISGSFSELSQLAGCTPEEAEKAVKEIEEKNVANVTCNVLQRSCNANVTLINRRMKTEHNKRNGNKLRVKKSRELHDCNATVTPYAGAVYIRGQKSETDIKENIYNKEILESAERILKKHPRQTMPTESLMDICQAIQNYHDKPPAKTMREAIAYIETRTEFYAAIVAQWPRDQMSYVTSSQNWYAKGCYYESEDEWKLRIKQQPAASQPITKFQDADLN